VNEPRVLFADEPTANLDNANVEQVANLFKELQQSGTAIIVTTHDERLERRADRLITMNDGMIVNAEMI
jgi:ABC-type lipoprotein export system ATPase subunit